MKPSKEVTGLDILEGMSVKQWNMLKEKLGYIAKEDIESVTIREYRSEIIHDFIRDEKNLLKYNKVWDKSWDNAYNAHDVYCKLKNSRRVLYCLHEYTDKWLLLLTRKRQTELHMKCMHDGNYLLEIMDCPHLKEKYKDYEIVNNYQTG